ncbi:UNVERIFIED_CONTAM: hypothetical protein FKN15_036321 [Acipenser sinensis]
MVSSPIKIHQIQQPLNYPWFKSIHVPQQVRFTGHGKTPKDAASVRATHPIPAACGIYYFEVKIVSKGRDGGLFTWASLYIATHCNCEPVDPHRTVPRSPFLTRNLTGTEVTTLVPTRYRTDPVLKSPNRYQTDPEDILSIAASDEVGEQDHGISAPVGRASTTDQEGHWYLAASLAYRRRDKAVLDMEKLGLAHFLPVEASFAALVQVPDLTLLSKDAICPNKQCQVLEAHVPDGDKAPLLDNPITPGHTFGPTVDEMVQRSHRWDKQSYGYHGDDGHSFCSSGTGQPYGPTFTTGDVIGCCVNLINNTCFYTKNGHSLGIAFTDLPPNLYPTVGLQTPGEVVDANFGQHPFVFDIEDYRHEWQSKIQTQIDGFPTGDREGEWQMMIQKWASLYFATRSDCDPVDPYRTCTEVTAQGTVLAELLRERSAPPTPPVPLGLHGTASTDWPRVPDGDKAPLLDAPGTPGHTCANVVSQKVTAVLQKRAIRMIYSRYFLVPKWDGGLRPILVLRQVNLYLSQRYQSTQLTGRLVNLCRVSSTGKGPHGTCHRPPSTVGPYGESFKEPAHAFPDSFLFQSVPGPQAHAGHSVRWQSVQSSCLFGALSAQQSTHGGNVPETSGHDGSSFPGPSIGSPAHASSADLLPASFKTMVSSYLVHHGYCATAEAFAKSTDQAVHEELASIKNRQKIQKLVLAGRMGEAIETTQQLYPSLVDRNPNLVFMLKMVSSYLVHHGYCATAEAFAKSTDQAVHEELASIKNRQKIQKLVQVLQYTMVSSYLVHHGYCATAEAFAKSTDQAVHEELASIKNRQKIQKLVLAGRMGEAIETTQQLYPSLVDRNPNLVFMLKVRQFIEMVNGTDSEVRCLGGHSPKSQDSYPGSPRTFSSPSMSPSHSANIHSLTLVKSSGSHGHLAGFDSNCSNGVMSNNAPHQFHCHKHQPSSLTTPDLNSLNNTRSQQPNSYTSSSNDVDMETDRCSNGVSELSSNGFLNGSSKHDHEMEECEAEMEIDSTQLRRQLCGGSQAAIERMIHFGRELQAMSEQLRRECGKNSTNKKMLKDAFSLLAYSDPWNSPVGYQLDSIQREPVCSALNSAILEIHNLPKQPPLAQAIGQATQCLGLMAQSGSGSCAFAAVEDYLH